MLKKLKERAKRLKSEAQVLRIAYQDNRTPWSAKLLIWITIGYLLSPIDLIPDFIPVLGLLDDLIIVPALIAISIKLIPTLVLAEARIKASSGAAKLHKKNWLFAGVIILAWCIICLAAYFLIRHFRTGHQRS